MITSSAIDRAALREDMMKDLTQNILPYWMDKMVDEEYGGFHGRRDGHDALELQADKGVILNTRILWTFSHAARVLHGSPDAEKYVATADHAYSYISRYFIDREKGGVYWMVDYEGNPVSTKKQVYAQAFAIYALSEYFMATQCKEALEKAIQLFNLVEKYSFDKTYNGYLEAFDKDWNLLEDLRLSDKDANEKKTMNTHLHVLEAYTNLFRCWKDLQLEKQLHNLINVFLDRIIDERHHFQLFFDEQWNVKSRVISFGHDIEGSWLLQEAAEVLEDNELVVLTQKEAQRMVDVTLSEGLDSDGGIMNEVHGNGAPDRDKHWWPQAEGLVGLVNAWQLTSNPQYLDHTDKLWKFIKQSLIDTEHGEWYWRVNHAGEVNRSEDKAGPWKCPYHNGRALMELMSRLS